MRMKRPTPWSVWTTGSPGFRSRKSERKLAERARRRVTRGGAATMAAPLITCNWRSGSSNPALNLPA